jgi:hypothetical protein
MPSRKMELTDSLFDKEGYYNNFDPQKVYCASHWLKGFSILMKDIKLNFDD